MAANRGKPEQDAPYQVVARRFRPHSFQEVVGQDEVLHSLRTALAQKKVPHAFLFSGSRGVGKTTSARILARCLNCEKGVTPDPCGTCDLCKSILDGSNPDVVEIDAASNNSVDDVRELREHTAFASMRSRYRVFILDEVHMLSKSAFNALLKTLEEPPPQVVFVLATTELHKVPETIRSRCQVLLFRRVDEPNLQKRLAMIAEKEGVAIAPEVLAEIATSVRGGVRDAETALEKILPLARERGGSFDLEAYHALVSRVGTESVVEVAQSLLQGDAKAALHFARELQRQGIDEREALGDLVEVLRSLMLLKVDGPDTGLVSVTGPMRERLAALAAATQPHQLDAMISAGLLGRERLRRLEDRGAVIELALLRMAQAGTLPTLADLLAEVRTGGGAAPAQARPAFGGGGGGGGPRGASVPAPATTGPLPPVTSASDLRSRVLAALKDRQMLQASVSECQFTGPDAQGKVVMTLQSERRMHRDRLLSPVLQQELTQVIAAAAGTPVKVEFRLGEDAAGAAPVATPPPKHAEPGPAAKLVMDRFRGRIVQVNPEDRIKKEPSPAGDGDGAPDNEQPPDLPPPDMQE